MAKREERLAHNQAVFRSANEAIERSTAGSATLLTFLCECGDQACQETISLTHAEYERVRSHPRHFALLRGHELEGDSVLEEFDRYTLVEKVGAAGEVAEERNPRAQ